MRFPTLPSGHSSFAAWCWDPGQKISGIATWPTTRQFFKLMVNGSSTTSETRETAISGIIATTSALVSQ